MFDNQVRMRHGRVTDDTLSLRNICEFFYGISEIMSKSQGNMWKIEQSCKMKKKYFTTEILATVVLHITIMILTNTVAILTNRAMSRL